MTPEQFKAHLYNVNVKDSRIHEEALLRDHAEQQAEIERLKAEIEALKRVLKFSTIADLQAQLAITNGDCAGRLVKKEHP